MRPPTTPLKSALERLGLKQSELAALVNVSSRTVSQWATGAKPLPAAVEGYLRLLATAPYLSAGQNSRAWKTLPRGSWRVPTG